MKKSDAVSGISKVVPFKSANRRTKVRIGILENQIVQALEDDHPQSVRHVFYLMTNPRLAEPVEKSERGYRHVQERLVALRRNGTVPFDWIVDATRSGRHVRRYAILIALKRLSARHHSLVFLPG